MCLLTNRDRRQLSANLWRAKVVVGRNRKQATQHLITPVIYTAILIYMAESVLKPTTIDIPAMGTYGVFSSNTSSTSYFIDSNSGLNSSMNLTNCTDFGWSRVGIVTQVDKGDA